MKMIAVILSLFTIFMSSYPCCQDGNACENRLENFNNSENSSQNEEPHESEWPYSPFYDCGCCVGVTITINEIVLVTFEHELEKSFIPYILIHPKEVLSILLKPPRFFEI